MAEQPTPSMALEDLRALEEKERGTPLTGPGTVPAHLRDVREFDPLRGPAFQYAHQEPALSASKALTEKPAQSDTDGLPLLPPTIAADLRAQGLEGLIPSLRASLLETRWSPDTRNLTGPNEINKLRALIDRAEKEPAFEKKLRAALNTESLSRQGRNRTQTAIEILDSARESGVLQGAPPGAISEAIQAALISKTPLGPKGQARAFITQNPKTGKTVMDIQQTHAGLRQRYYTEYLNEHAAGVGKVPPGIVAEANKHAAEMAAKDIIGISKRFQGLPFLDQRSPELVKELAGSAPGVRALRAHFRTRTSTEIFAPTLEEIEKEGGFWEFFRKISPAEFAAPQVKLFREYLEREHPRAAPYLLAPVAGIFSPISTMVILGTPVGLSERLLQEIGYTPEDIVNEYLDGRNWFEEASEAYSLITKESFILQGATEEEAELERKRARTSKVNKLLSFVTYFGDPDAITMGLITAGPVAVKAVSTYFKNDLSRALNVARAGLDTAETPAELIKQIHELNPSVARILEVHIDSSLERATAKIGNTTKQLEKAEAKFKTAEEALETAARESGSDVAAFVKSFILQDGTPISTTEALLQSINAVRANPNAAGHKGMLDQLITMYDDALELAAASLEQVDALQTLVTKHDATIKEIYNAVIVRDRVVGPLQKLADRVVHTVSFGDGPKAAKAAKEFWFVERRVQQLEVLKTQIKSLESMAEIPEKLREQLLVRWLLENGKTFRAAPSTVDDLSVKELIAVATELKLPRAKALGRTLVGRKQLRIAIREHARTLSASDLAVAKHSIDTRLAALKQVATRKRSAAQKAMGVVKFSRLLSDQKELRKLSVQYRKALAAAPGNSKTLLADHAKTQRALQEALERARDRGKRATKAAVRSFSMSRAFGDKRLKLPTGKKGKAIREGTVSAIFKLGQEAPDAFKLSANAAKGLAQGLGKVRAQQKAFNTASETLDIAQRREGWRDVAREVIDRLAEGRDKLTARQVWNEAVYRIRPGADPKAIRKVISAYINITEDGTELLYQRNGKSILEALKEVGVNPKQLQGLLDITGESGLIMQRLLDGQKAVKLTADSLAEIQTTFAKAIQSLEAAQKGAAQQALNAIRSQAHLPRGAKQSAARKWIGTVVSPFAFTIRWLGRPGEAAFHQKLGVTNEESVTLLRAADQLNNQRTYEISGIIRFVAAAKNSPKLILGLLDDYFSNGTAMEIGRKGKATMHTVTNVGEPLLLRAKRRAILWHRGLTKAELDKLAADSAIHTKIYPDDGKFDPTVQGLSRIWIGETVPTPAEAARLYEEALELFRNEEIVRFQELVTGMEEATKKVLGREAQLDGRHGRVYGFAAESIGLAATLDQLTPLIRATTAGILTPDQVADANRVLSGSGLSYVKDPDAAFNTLLQIGGALLEPRVAKGFKETVGKLKKLVKVGVDPQGNDLWVTGALRTELMSSLNGKIKELHKVSENQPTFVQQSWDFVTRDLLSAWKQSVTMGLLFPNAGYITYVRIGDASQLFLTSGTNFALRTQLQNVWSDIPFFGRAFQDRLSTQVAKTKKPALRGALESTFSPHMADFFSGKQGFWRLKNGEVVSWEGLRKRATMEGIVDVFPNAELEEGLRIAGASQIDALISGNRKFQRLIQNDWSEGIKAFSTQTQIRQRVGTWLLHISDGKSIDEASKLVRESLYDWSHGVSKWEQEVLAKAMPFWRYWRLATAQSYEAFLQPFMNPTVGGFLKAAYGDTRLNRFRLLARSQMDLDRALVDPRTVDEIVDEDGYAAGFARVFTPPWLKTQFMLHNRRNSEQMQRDLAKLQRPGKQLLNTAGVLAPYHGIDHLETMFLPFFGLTALALAAVGEDSAAEHFGRFTVSGLMDKLSPWHRDILEESYAKPGTDLISIRPVQAWMLNNMSGVRVEFDPETGRHYTSKAVKKTLDYFPIIGTELARTLDAVKFKNPQIKDDAQKGLMRMFLEYTRIVREYSYDPFLQFDIRMKDSLTKYTEDTKRAGYLIEEPDPVRLFGDR